MVEPSASTANTAQKAPQSLDELMLAMDVVDTLRHQDNLVARELSEERRDAELLERLRHIYQGQGTDVSDRVLREGVQALKERRFVYTPAGPSFARTLAIVWIDRRRIGRGFLTILAILGFGWGAYHLGVERPAREQAAQAQAQAERTRMELGETLPRALEQGHADVLQEARIPAAGEKADRILADGRAAIARGDAAGARQAIDDLEVLRADLRREFTLRIVSRPGEPSGVWRVPQRNPTGRNYYLIVEPVTSDGRILSLPVTSEEDGRTVTTSKWGVRVSEDLVEQVRQDKNDDGIVQRNRLGSKRRGYLEIDYLMPVLGGAITRW
jgi:Family of unknown function (DUF6384)